MGPTFVVVLLLVLNSDNKHVHILGKWTRNFFFGKNITTNKAFESISAV